MKKRIAIMGCGHLGCIVAAALGNGLLENYELAGAYSRKLEDAKRAVELAGSGKVCETADELIEQKADFLVETASIALLKETAEKALLAGTSIVPLSIGAFADKEFKAAAGRAARLGNARIHIPAGVVGGFDALLTASLMAEAGVDPEHPYGKEEKTEITAGIRTRKGPKSLMATPLFEEHLMTDTEDTVVFEGTTAEAIALLPTKVNVAVASALVSTGPDTATARIISVPGMAGDDHLITASTQGINVSVDIYSKTSDMAGWSVVALLRNLDSEFVFF